MARQYFGSFVGEAPVVNQTQIAAAADTILWNPAGLASNTAIAANSIAPGQVFKLAAWGVTTTAVTGSQTLIVNPRFGTTASGTLLGASRAAPVNAVVQTNVPWWLEMFVHFRTIGASGTATCGGVFHAPTVIGTAATTNAAPLNFGTAGTTPTTVDTTVASGLVVSAFPSLSTQVFTTLGVVMETAN